MAYAQTMIANGGQNLIGFWERFGRLLLAPRLPFEPLPNQRLCFRPLPAILAHFVRHCVNETTMGGLSSYTELITCLEMARDVRALRSAAAAPSQAATARSSSPASTPTVQPAPSTAQPTRSPPAAQPTPADSTSRPQSPIEPQMRTGSTPLKELQQAQADALDAKTSEAATRRKLADAEADLKRAKEEAARASQEAKQARADAQSARESQAKAENKVADLEAARTATEEQIKACQNAPKSQSGFGARLRSWFGHKPSNP